MNFSPWIDLQEQARWIFFKAMSKDGFNLDEALGRAEMSRRQLRRIVLSDTPIALGHLASWAYAVKIDLKFEVEPREDRPHWHPSGATSWDGLAGRRA